MKQHKTKWTWVSGSGGYQYFDTKSEAVGHALTYGGFGIYAPIYNEVTA
jgi:hypothetical protein